MEAQSMLSALERTQGYWSQIEAVIDQQERLLDLLKGSRNVLKNVLDVQRSYMAPIRRLPQEILSEIMEWACGDDVDLSAPLCAPLALAAVCKTWRAIALACPKLWTTWSTPDDEDLLGSVWPETSKLSMIIPRLEIFLARSGNLPLVQPIKYEHQSYLLKPPNAWFLDVLLHHTQRWQHLQIINSSFSVQHPQDFAVLKGKPVPPLHALSGDARHLQLAVDSGVFRDFPRLRVVMLLDPNHTQIIPGLPWNQIQILAMNEVTIMYVLEILRQCPNLRTIGLKVETQGHAPIGDGVVNLPNLVNIRLDTNATNSYDTLAHITAPALHNFTFRWEGHHQSNSTLSDSLPAFLSRSSCALRNLTLHRPSSLDYAVLASQRDVTNFRWYAVEDLPVPVDFVAKLTTLELFPRLERLELGGFVAFRGGDLVNLAKARMAAGCPLQVLKLEAVKVLGRPGLEDDAPDRLEGLVPVFEMSV
ncbi:uncharacterized protein SCHCODRAFT_02695869 [Schizophyllum commune H4-8]|nr:uncharacterized protein SCHCODRAFT_02695869 [Schizophyllum commune H4-8]KAI5900706.1 hypothetical protein SCHCODRAFT_02695869 [Schizophyllum commune H4-8]